MYECVCVFECVRQVGGGSTAMFDNVKSSRIRS